MVDSYNKVNFLAIVFVDSRRSLWPNQKGHYGLVTSAVCSADRVDSGDIGDAKIRPFSVQLWQVQFPLNNLS